MSDDDDLIALRLSDDDLKRAESILRAGGFIINETAVRMLPHMANAIRIYQHMDRAAARNEALEEAARVAEAEIVPMAADLLDVGKQLAGRKIANAIRAMIKGNDVQQA
jgi:hypothetical protein